MVLFRYDHCTTHHNPQLALQRLRWKEKLQVIAEDLTSMTFHCKFGFWEHLLRMFQYWAQPQFFAINTSLPQNLPCFKQYIITKHCKKTWLVSKYVKNLWGKKNVQAVSTLQFDTSPIWDFPHDITAGEFLGLAMIRTIWAYSTLLGDPVGILPESTPHDVKKNMEKGISENSIPCSLLVVGSLHFAKSTDQTAKDTKTELILIVTNNTKLAFDCMTNLLDKKSTNMAGMAGLRWCP